MWLLFSGLSATEIGRLVYGGDSPVVAAAFKVVAIAGCTLVLILPFGVAPVMAFLAVGWAAIPDLDLMHLFLHQAPNLKSSGEAPQEMLRDPIMITCLILAAFALLVPIGELIKGDSPVKGSGRERMGSVISHVGLLGIDAVDCLVICPILTVRIWRT
ncbi:hypothetical protein BS78_07G136000 [Paspalum vaginatum]|nr:hypothetical protein BS78_07G136000 [Paspalum vaginatum]